jgi:HD-GYP domain-containing protein (c-di-GMP phosphodiesterase class II)
MKLPKADKAPASMEEVRLQIQKISKILAIACEVFQIVLIVSICIVGCMAVASFFSESQLTQLAPMLLDESIFAASGSTEALFDDLPLRTAALAAAGIHIVTRAIAVVYLTFFMKVFKNIKNGGDPFDREVARRIRIVSYTTLMLAFINPVTGILVALVGVLFSYILEYGAYLQDKAGETSRIQEEMIVSFAEITENKSQQTGQHIRRVAEYSKVLARELGYSEEDVEKIGLASTMHDVGKLLVPSEILEKPGRLTDEEFAEIKKHPGYGGQLLNTVEGDVMNLARTIALEHHERADGRGYPGGKPDENISREGRIVAVADVYDALTSRRSYKEAWDEQRAYDEIVKGSGTQFDAEVVEAFKNAYPQILRIRTEFADQA